jgi:hypothetical protein
VNYITSNNIYLGVGMSDISPRNIAEHDLVLFLFLMYIKKYLFVLTITMIYYINLAIYLH